MEKFLSQKLENLLKELSVESLKVIIKKYPIGRKQRNGDLVLAYVNLLDSIYFNKVQYVDLLKDFRKESFVITPLNIRVLRNSKIIDIPAVVRRK